MTSSVKHGRYINEEMSSNEVNIGSQGAYESNASSEEYISSASGNKFPSVKDVGMGCCYYYHHQQQQRKKWHRRGREGGEGGGGRKGIY